MAESFIISFGKYCARRRRNKGTNGIQPLQLLAVSNCQQPGIHDKIQYQYLRLICIYPSQNECRTMWKWCALSLHFSLSAVLFQFVFAISLRTHFYAIAMVIYKFALILPRITSQFALFIYFSEEKQSKGWKTVVAVIITAELTWLGSTAIDVVYFLDSISCIYSSISSQ